MTALWPVARPSVRLCAFAAVAAAVAILTPVTSAHAFEVPKVLDDGWQSRARLFGERTTGASSTTSLSARLSGQYRQGRFEGRLDTRYLRSTASLDVARTDANGDAVVGADGDVITDEVSRRSRDRRYLLFEPRWYLSGEKMYLFGLLDADRDRPTGVDLSLRQIAGVGYRLWGDKKNFLAAGIGLGEKRLRTTGGTRDDSGIGYFGIKLALQTSERTRIGAELDSDFGGSNDFTEFSLTFGLELTGQVSLSFAFQASVNSEIDAADSASANSLDSRTVIGFEVDLPG